jgi:peptidoglycan hydrolase-like protein with peptidoglycan-binding domain
VRRRLVLVEAFAAVALSGATIGFGLISTQEKTAEAMSVVPPVDITTAPLPATTTTVPTTTAPVAPTSIAPVPSGQTETQAAQHRLLDLGYWLDKTDGKAGAITQQAVYAFQKVEGLAKTGKLDPPTLQALATAQRPAAASASGNLIEIDKTRQVIFVVRGGQVQWVFNTSTGTEKRYSEKGGSGIADTPPGHFAFGRQVDGVDKGPLGNLYRPRYFHGGIAVHGAPSIPPYPASHGCARVSNGAMDFIWSQDLMPKASPIWVYGESPVR